MALVLVAFLLALDLCTKDLAPGSLEGDLTVLQGGAAERQLLGRVYVRLCV